LRAPERRWIGFDQGDHSRVDQPFARVLEVDRYPITDDGLHLARTPAFLCWMAYPVTRRQVIEHVASLRCATILCRGAMALNHDIALHVIGSIPSDIGKRQVRLSIE